MLKRDVFFPSVYDALLVVRPSCHFRDGRVITNYPKAHYFLELPFHDGYLSSVMHLIPANYPPRLHTLYIFLEKQCEQDIILGFASVFLFLKSYASCLIGELSQLCYKGVLRTIALASTDGMCTWRCVFLMGPQPVIVPVGRIALGRIFNVVGSIMDPYMELSLSSGFSSRFPIDNGGFVESHPNLTYTLSYANAIFSRISYCFTPKLFTFFNTMIINTILFVWIFYIALLYQNYLFGEHVSSIIPCMLILKQIDCSINALATTMQAVSFHIDTLFGCVKPIHQTGLAILTLRI